METARLQANIWKLYALKVLRGFMLMMPIMVLFLQDIGLSLTEIFISQAVFSVVAIVLEIPSGYFADRYGMRLSLIIGSLFAFLGVATYALSFDFITVLFAEVLLGISLAFISGADSALLYETLEALGRTTEYKAREGVLVAANTASEGIASIAGGFIALISLRLPVAIQALLLLVMVGVAYALYEPPHIQKKRTVLASGSALSVMWRTFVHTMHTNKALKWLVLYAAVIDTATLVSVWLRQPYFSLAELPLAWFGIVWALLMFATTAAALASTHFEKLAGKAYGLITLLAAATLCYIILGTLSASLMLVPLFAIWSIVRGFKEPLLREYVQALADPSVRATILSIKGFIGRAVFVIIGPLVGYVADMYTLHTALLAAGVICGTFGAVTVVQLMRHRVL